MEKKKTTRKEKKKDNAKNYDIKNKKFIIPIFLALIIIVVLIVGLIFINRPMKFTITPNETEVKPGDIITYNVKISSVRNLASMKFKLVIPEGLTFIEGTEVDDLKSKLNAAKAEFTASTKVFIVGSSDYSSWKDTELMTFKCSVNDDASGKKDITLIIDEDDIFDTSKEMNNIKVEYSDLDSTINIKKSN